MIYLVRPTENKSDMLLYVCSIKETEIVLNEIQNFNIDYISCDDGIIAYENDPFLLMQINAN
jgi:hypothetical protein